MIKWTENVDPIQYMLVAETFYTIAYSYYKLQVPLTIQNNALIKSIGIGNGGAVGATIDKFMPSCDSSSEIQWQSEEDLDCSDEVMVELNQCKGQASASSHSAISELIRQKQPGEALESGDEIFLDNTTMDCHADCCNPARDESNQTISKDILTAMKLTQSSHLHVGICKLAGLSNTTGLQ